MLFLNQAETTNQNPNFGIPNRRSLWLLYSMYEGRVLLIGHHPLECQLGSMEGQAHRNSRGGNQCYTTTTSNVKEEALWPVIVVWFLLIEQLVRVWRICPSQSTQGSHWLGSIVGMEDSHPSQSFVAVTVTQFDRCGQALFRPLRTHQYCSGLA